MNYMHNNCKMSHKLDNIYTKFCMSTAYNLMHQFIQKKHYNNNNVLVTWYILHEQVHKYLVQVQ